MVDEVRNPVCNTAPKSRIASRTPARRSTSTAASPLDQRRYAAPVDTPANEDTPWPEGVDVRYVPDMPVGNAPDDGG